jgi:hypothetical protein
MALMLFPITLGFLFLGLFYLPLGCALVAHYANVVEDIGPYNKDELPRPFRDLDLADDLAGPFFRFMLALFIAYGVGLTAFYLPGAARAPFLVAVGVYGTIVFPALLLTITCSGSILNLRPDRVIRVIKACGPAYILLIAGWLIGSVAYLGTFAAANLSMLHLFDLDKKFFYDWYLNPVLAFPAMLLAVIFMHALAWYLGLQYRQHAGEFDWALQVHERDPNLPKKRGFEVQRPHPAAKPVQAIAAQPVIPIERDGLEEETPADAAERRRRILEQSQQVRPAQPHGVQHPIRPETPFSDALPPASQLPPPDDNFDIDELLKP